MSLQTLDSLSVRMRSIPFFLRLTLFTRILLAAGFIPTGMVKLLGHRFTLMAVDTPVGAFFEAMYQTGGYWRFLGLSQVVAGLLLLFPRWAHVGALLFLPIMANIFVVTVALSFGMTAVVTGSMLLAVLYLCAWDYHRFRSMLTEQPWTTERSVPDPKLDRLERVGFCVFAVALLLVFGATRSLVAVGLVLPCVVIGLAVALFTLVRFLVVARRLTV